MIIIKMNMITESEHYGATTVAVCNWCLLIVVGVTTVITPAITTGPHNITLINHALWSVNAIYCISVICYLAVFFLLFQIKIICKQYEKLKSLEMKAVG